MARAAGPASTDDLALSGRVVEVTTRKPIAGAEISLGANGQDGEPLKPEQVVSSDADGRFTLRIRPDREGEMRPPVIVRVRHRDYVARQSQQRSYEGIRQDAARGAKPFFDTIELDRGEEYRLRVVSLEDDPAEGCDVAFSGDTQSGDANTNPSPLFFDDNRARADALGWVRVRMPKCIVINVNLTSPQFAQMAHNFNANDRQRYPTGTLPHDLGKIVLSRGIAMKGRVVDLRGKPIADLTVQAQSSQTGMSRSGKTDASGEFLLAALTPGGYLVSANGWGSVEGPRSNLEHPIGPKIVQIDAKGGATVELKEVPSVAVQARFVDAKGRPARSGNVWIYGQIAPPPPGPKAPLEAEMDVLFNDPAERETPTFRSFIGEIFGNDLPRMQRTRSFQWMITTKSDAEGRVVIRVPKGLLNATMSVNDPSGLHVYTTADKPENPANAGFARLGALKEDHAPIEFTVYRAASLTVRILTDDGGIPPEQLNVQAYIILKGRNWGGGSGEIGSDGVYRLTGMVPDRPYQVYANSNDYLPTWVEGVTLAAGESRELTLTLSKSPEPVKVGDLAPPIFVTSFDGKPRSLADYQGQFLLITFWTPQNQPDTMTKIKALRDQLGAVDRLALLGLSLDNDRTVLEANLKERKIDWPQARLEGRGPYLQAVYGCNKYPCSVLIGPDGTIVALNLGADEVEAAVAKALKK